MCDSNNVYLEIAASRDCDLPGKLEDTHTRTHSETQLHMHPKPPIHIHMSRHT